MSRLPITNDYPPDWPAINARVCEEAGHRCIRCGHPYRKGTHGKGQWTPCDRHCRHQGPIRLMAGGDYRRGWEAEWRILTVHHMDGDKSNCEWWNLLALCQRCHLTIQGNINPHTPYFLEHSEWFRPYVAAFYAKKYEGKLLSRAEVMSRLDELLAYERLV